MLSCGISTGKRRAHSSSKIILNYNVYNYMIKNTCKNLPALYVSQRKIYSKMTISSLVYKIAGIN